MKMILLSLVMLLIAFEPAFSGKILKKLDKELKKMGLQKLQKFLADIGENALDIGDVQNDIDSNTVHIKNNTMDIHTNANEIDSNIAHIDNNAMNIGDVQNDIGDVQNEIGVIQNEIDSNTAHIDNNAVNIGDVQNDIVSQGSRLLDLETMGSGSVWFDAYNIYSVEASGNYAIITYSNRREASSYSGAIDIGTGVFTAPLAGTYQFIIQAMKDPYVRGHVRILMEGTVVSFIADDDTSYETTITGTAIVDMQPGQKVWAETLYTLISGGWAHTHFTGVLITQE